MITADDISDLLPLMPRAVDLVWNRSSVPPQYAEAGAELPKPVLHFALPLDASGRVEARAFLQDHGPHDALTCAACPAQSAPRTRVLALLRRTHLLCARRRPI